jgi:hypothetical protein
LQVGEVSPGCMVRPCVRLFSLIDSAVLTCGIETCEKSKESKIDSGRKVEV